MKQSTNSKYSEAQNTSCARGQTIKTNQAHMLNYKLQNESLVSVNIGDSLRSQSELVTSDEIVGHDASGWPLYQLRVISLLRAIGIPEDIINQVPDDILTTHISTLDEDDVGHCTNEQKVINCNIDKEHGIVYLWV